MGWFDKHKEAEESQASGKAAGEASPFGLSEQEQLQKEIFVSTFAMLAKLASADGRVSKTEVEAVQKFITNVLKLEKDKRDFAVRVFNESRKCTKTFREYAEDYRKQLQCKPEMFEWMVDVLLRISLADKTFSESESKMLRDACDVFGISEQRFEQIISRYRKKRDDTHYRILGCTVQTSIEDIEIKYLALCSEYDPERILSLGLPEEFQKVAEEKFTAVKQAYILIRRERGLD